MTKFKKLVVAAVAAVGIGVVSTTAFAAVTDLEFFELSFEAREENVFSESAKKTTSFANDAVVTVDYGANYSRPVTFSVWDSADELYGFRLTKSTTVRANGESQYMSYGKTGGYAGEHDWFYLNASSPYSMNIEGTWAP